MAKVTDGRVRSLGITCALCHSTVDDSVAEGIGHRLDGWPNLDLNVGAIVGLSKSPAWRPSSPSSRSGVRANTMRATPSTA